MTDENTIPFHHSIRKTITGILVIIVFIAGAFIYVTNFFNPGHHQFYLYIAYAIMILFGYLFIAGLFTLYKALAKFPYMLLTDHALVIQPETKKEIIIHRNDIINYSLVNIHSRTSISLYIRNASTYSEALIRNRRFQLFHQKDNDISTFQIDLNPLNRRMQTAFLEVLQVLIDYREDENVPIVNIAKEKIHGMKGSSLYKRNFMPHIQPDKTINKKYFIHAYGYSLFFFIINFTVFYYLTTKSTSYLLFITISFIIYPFAQALTDWLYGFKIKQIEQYGGHFARLLDQFKFLIDAFIVFHLSIFIAPISGLFFGIRYLIHRNKK